MAGFSDLSSLVLLLLLLFPVARADDKAIDQRCASEASKLTECVGYASGEEAAPTGECCGSVSDVKGKDPACLCLVIRRAHDGGSSGVSGLHLRLDRLLSLPKACALTNSSVSYCPKLLGLPPSSPDSAIFTNASYANPQPTASATSKSSSGAAVKLNSYMPFLVVAVSAIFFPAFQIGAWNL